MSVMNTTVEFEGEDLVIRIPKDFVYATVVLAPDSTVVERRDAESFPEHAVMEEFEEFSVELLNHMRMEDASGWSLINEMIHRASESALESGAYGVSYPDY